MIRAAEFEDLQGTAPLFPYQDVAQDNYVVSNKLLNARTGDLALLLGPFRGHDSSHLQFFQGRGNLEHPPPDSNPVGQLRENGIE
jgi:hypothetical protein